MGYGKMISDYVAATLLIVAVGAFIAGGLCWWLGGMLLAYLRAHLHWS